MSAGYLHSDHFDLVYLPSQVALAVIESLGPVG